DKYIKNIYSPSGFGETQIAANIIACRDENIHATNNEESVDETIFAICVLSIYITFYKTEIPAKYWTELSRGLPKTDIIVKRWLGENAKRKSLDLVEPNRRKAVLDALANIRKFLLHYEQPEMSDENTPATSMLNASLKKDDE
ncbi:24265_t:CDS:2, partial [Racocetra persica]